MPSIQGLLTLAGSNVFETSGTDEHGVGNFAFDSAGRILRWVKAGGSNVSRGKLQLAPAPKTNHHDLAVATIAIGATSITGVTPGATAVVANEYAGGLMVVNDDTGEGMAYEIYSHPAADASTAFTITLKDPVKVALGASATVTLVHNAANGVVEGTSTTNNAAGVACNNITAAEFGWVVTFGVNPALIQGTIDLGADLVAGSVAGSVGAAHDTAANNVDQVKVGNAIIAGVDTEYQPILVRIV